MSDVRSLDPKGLAEHDPWCGSLTPTHCLAG
jgi:hypothetical protein